MVAQVNPYRFGVPVLQFARQEAAPFEQQDSLSGRGQGVRQRPSSGAGSDDDYVVVIVHVSSPANGPVKLAQAFTRSPAARPTRRLPRAIWHAKWRAGTRARGRLRSPQGEG